MHNLVCFLAQSDFVKEPPRPTALPQVSRFVPEAMGILGIAFALAAVLFIWAFFIRKRRHPDPHVRTLQEGSIFQSSPAKHHSHHHHGRRRRHRRHRHGQSDAPRNPTLQETGGLPPVRSEEDFPRI